MHRVSCAILLSSKGSRTASASPYVWSRGLRHTVLAGHLVRRVVTMQSWPADVATQDHGRPARSPSLPRSPRRMNAFTVLIVDEGEQLTLRPAPDNPIEALRGILAGKARSEITAAEAKRLWRGAEEQRRDGTQMARVLRRVVVDTGPICRRPARRRRRDGDRVGAGQTNCGVTAVTVAEVLDVLIRVHHTPVDDTSNSAASSPTLRGRSRQRGRSPSEPRSFGRATTTAATATSRSRTASLSQPQFRTPTSRRRTRRSRGLPERRGST